MGFSAGANAQVCMISGGEDKNDNVEVLSADLNLNNGIVYVRVGNDSRLISANVTVEVEVSYKKGSNTKKKKFTGKGLASANEISTIRIPCFLAYPDDADYKAVSVEAMKITGTKCK